MSTVSPTTDPSDAATLVAALRRQWGAQVVETHISWVLLDGRTAWKIKKPVQLPFLDATSLSVRRRLCEDELRLNRRYAPALYLDVASIYGTPGSPRLEPEGEPIEYAVHMRQFDGEALWSARLVLGRLAPGEVDGLAQTLAAFHAGADHTVPPDLGTPHRIEAATGAVLQALRRLCAQDPWAASALDAVRGWLNGQVQQLRAVWAARRAQGRVVEGHGDLHLGNVATVDGVPTPFDGIEFDAALRWIDVMSDAGFLMMDLWAHGRDDLAWRFLNAYLEHGGDYAGLSTLRYYLVYRALVREMVGRLRGVQGAGPAGPDYLGLAEQLVQAGVSDPAGLLITHGLSGSGKSFVTQRLLEHAQAVRVRSDVERKRLLGLPPMADTAVLGADAYAAPTTQLTYARLREAAAQALAAGYRVIVDATFLQAEDREAFARLAREREVSFSILHCHAPPELLRARVQARHERQDDASEADLVVLDHQARQAQSLSAQEQAVCIDADTGTGVDVAALARRWTEARAR